MYLYLSSTSDYFNVKMPDGMDLSGESIGLAEIHFEMENNIDCFDLCCDICESSVVDSTTLPILRRIHVSSQQEYIRFDPIYYIPVIKTKPYIITVYLRSVHSKSNSVPFKRLNCTLHTKP